MVMRRAALMVAAASVFGSGVACTDFESPTTVIDLRVLGIKAEPSEILLDADVTNPAMPTIDPANNPPVTITPLIVDPLGREISYTVVACPNNPFGAAPPGPGGMGGGGPFPSGGARTSVGSTMCDPDSPLTWPMTAAPVVVPPDGAGSFTFRPSDDKLLAAFRADVFVDQFMHIHGGFDLGMPLNLQLNIQAGGESLIAIKRVLYWARRVSDAHTPNQLPTIAALNLFDDRDPTSGELLGGPQPLVVGTPVRVPAGTKPWIDPAFDPALAEPYETTILDPTTHLAVPTTVPRERWRYAYYATAGTFAPFRTSSELQTGFTGTVHVESQYTSPTTVDGIPVDSMGRHLVTIWVVVRDDRGGEDWRLGTLEIVPP
jgi:hypothetical protein